MIDTAQMKERLAGELALVEQELTSIGRKNPENPADWEATPTEMDVTEENEIADKIESFEENTAILKELEIRYNDIKRALKKIEDGAYGVCEISGTPIEEDRLEVNPAARTCKEHMGDESSLPA